MKLVIAEKPSVARAIAGAVGARSRENGYIEGAGYVVTWCHGHLVDLADPDSYEGWTGPWDLSKLPMLPRPWKWAASEEDGASSQLKVIERLMGRADVDYVVNACDSDREGEGIFRRVYEYLGCEKPVKRFWSTSLVDDAILADLGRMKDGAAYDGLGDAAEGRAKADWLVGLNGTRAYTKAYRSRQVLSVGRVQTPVLAMVVDRTRKVEGFVPEPFWRVVADLGAFSVVSERFDEQGGALALAERAKRAGKATIRFVERKDVRAKAPTLYDLTSLQRDASTRCGLTADATLKALQALYEKKLATYPRTDSKFITSEDAGEAARLLPVVSAAGVVGEEAFRAFEPSRADIARVVNDKKVSGHGAILPTSMLDEKAMAGLKGAERSVMLLVCCRLLAAVMEAGTRTHTKLEADIDGTRFSASGSIVKDASWIAVDEACRTMLKNHGDREVPDADADSDSETIPTNVSEGDVLDVVEAKVKEGKTSSPKLYTDATLLSAMENAGRDIEDADLKAAITDDSSHSGGLGTPATRADTIERIIGKGYAERRGRSIAATDKGKQLIDCVAGSLKTPLLTAEWEAQLSAIEHGEAGLGTFLEGIEHYTEQVVREAVDTADPALFQDAAKTIGACPLCGSPVVASKSGKSWHCANQRWDKDDDGRFHQAGTCTLFIGKVAGKQLTEKQAVSLLAGKTVAAKGLKSKKGKTFDCGLKLDEHGEVKFVFDDKPGKKARKKG